MNPINQAFIMAQRKKKILKHQMGGPVTESHHPHHYHHQQHYSATTSTTAASLPQDSQGLSHSHQSYYPTSAGLQADSNVFGSTAGLSSERIVLQMASFDPDRCLSCSVESGHTLVHGTGSRGYGLGTTLMTSGCYQWKV